MTSPEPISTADREKLAEQRQAYIDNPSNTWFYQLYFHAALEAIPAYESRVVELEAALKAAEGKDAEQKRIVALLDERNRILSDDCDASEARASAAVAALRPFAAEADRHDDLNRKGYPQVQASEVQIALFYDARAVLADRPQEGTQK